MALVAERTNPETGEREIMGVARLSRLATGFDDEAELSVLVSDHFQRQGIGTLLVSKLLEVARAEGIRRITARSSSRTTPCSASARSSASASTATQRRWSSRPTSTSTSRRRSRPDYPALQEGR